MIERRIKDICSHCGAEMFKWLFNGKVMKACIVCGEEIEAKRESDFHEFHKEVDTER
jgi:uncharacterized protein (DUF983 family)